MNDLDLKVLKVIERRLDNDDFSIKIIKGADFIEIKDKKLLFESLYRLRAAGKIDFDECLNLPDYSTIKLVK